MKFRDEMMKRAGVTALHGKTDAQRVQELEAKLDALMEYQGLLVRQVGRSMFEVLH